MDRIKSKKNMEYLLLGLSHYAGFLSDQIESFLRALVLEVSGCTTLNQ